MTTRLQREGGLTVAWSLGVNIVLAAAKLSVGFLASSQALLADGIHSLVDILLQRGPVLQKHFIRRFDNQYLIANSQGFFHFFLGDQ